MLILIVGPDPKLNAELAESISEQTNISINHGPLDCEEKYKELLKAGKNLILLDNHISDELKKLTNDTGYSRHYGNWREMEDDLKNDMVAIYADSSNPNIGTEHRLMYQYEANNIYRKYSRLNWIIIVRANAKNAKELSKDILKNVGEFNDSRLRFIKV